MNQNKALLIFLCSILIIAFIINKHHYNNKRFVCETIAEVDTVTTSNNKDFTIIYKYVANGLQYKCRESGKCVLPKGLPRYIKYDPNNPETYRLVYNREIMIDSTHSMRFVRFGHMFKISNTNVTADGKD